ncbi:MAG: tetrahydromethanopterin S-methyltransferase subunit H, partial [Candidatus Bathyarchaeota archaeon]|nr:tetrahydromethanopterin S-methyltransferase subunit H [Candidatus Bathyarchaeota archaeon]
IFEFSAEQKTYEIHGVRIGGEPGMVPTVMVGSMFYKGHRVVEDGAKGVFDEDEAEAQLRKAEEQSDRTGLPSMVDLVAENATAAGRFMDFVAGVSEMPILLDVLSEEGQVESLQYASDQGLIDRIVLNSLTPHSREPVYKKLKEVGCRSAVLLLYTTRSILSSDKSAVLEELLPKAEGAGIENILVDTTVIDIPTLGIATKAIYGIKDRYGYPAGCGSHNAIQSWKGLKTKYTQRAVTTSTGVANALPAALGADFVIYGPMDSADAIYPAVALIDAAYSQLMMEKRRRPGRDHPRFRIG